MFSIADVKKLALLSRLKLSEKEMEKLVGELSSIMSFVDQIEGAPRTEQDEKPLQINVLRPDTDAYTKGLFAEKILAAAPSREGRLFKVKKIITRS